MKFLILGGNGYLGSKVTHLLVEQGHAVTCVKRENSNLIRVNDIKDKISWISASVEEVKSAIQECGFDYLINLACDYGRGTASDERVIESNLIFPLKVLSCSIDGDIKNYITLGTGLPDDINAYAFTKSVFDDFGKYYVCKKGISFVSLKLEMFYGSDEPADRFLPATIRKMIKGEEVNVTLGTQKRDIIFSEDVIKAIMMIINADLIGYNEIPVGTGISPSIAEVVRYIWEETGKRSKVNFGSIPMRPNEADCIADVSKLQEIGDWQPVQWKMGIKRMINEIGGNIQHEDID